MNKKLLKQKKMHKDANIACRCLLFAMFFFTFNSYVIANNLQYKITIEQLSEKLISLNYNDKSIVDILSSIKKQVGLDYILADGLKPSEMGKFSINVTNISLKSTLDKLFASTSYESEITNSRIVISKKNIPIAKTQKQAERIIIKGRVLDTKKIPIAGATVIVENSNTGDIANSNGDFSISLKAGEKLNVSFMGYKSVSRVINNNENNITITLEREILEVDEVMVVAYGTTTKRSTTGSVSSVKAKDIEGVPSGNIANLLQGRVAGMDITNMSGAPGGGGTVTTIRGYNSLDVEASRRFSNPLWVVDGVPMNTFTSPVTGTNMLSDINPDMIESVQVLKDAAAAAIYGSRAANGVIIVTTKQGKKNQASKFEVNFSHTFSILDRLPPATVGNAERRFRLNAMMYGPKAYLDPETNTWVTPSSMEEILKYYKSGTVNSTYNPLFPYVEGVWDNKSGIEYQDSLNTFYMNQTNFFPMYTQAGYVTNANIQTYGGGDKSSYGLGVGYYGEDGVIKGSKFNRLNLTSSLNVSPVKNLSVDFRLNMTYSARKRGNRDGMGDYNIETVPGDAFSLSSILPGEGTEAWDMVRRSLSGVQDRNMNFRTIGSFKIGYDILPNLNFSTMASADFSLARRNEFRPSYLSNDYFAKSIGQTGLNMMFLNENFLTYSQKINNNNSFSIMAGLSYQYDRDEMNYGHAINGPDKIEYAPEYGMPDYIIRDERVTTFKNYWSSMAEKAMISYFGRIEYNFMERVYLSATFRSDGSSVFGRNNKWANFPSIAGSWIFSDNEAKGKDSWLSLGKFRASWGTSGMSFSQTYLALGLLQLGEFPYNGKPTYKPEWKEGLYNEDLRWEKTTQYDLGVDFDMLQSRLSLTVDYYLRITDDMLTLIPLPGYGTHLAYQRQWRNAASVSNEGIELSLKYDIIRKNNLYLKMIVTCARNWNRFRESYNGTDVDNFVIGKSLSGIYAVKTDGYYNSQDEIPYYESLNGNFFLGDKNIKGHEQYKVGDKKIIDINGDGMINNSDYVYIGSSLPKISGGWVTELRWKNFNLNMSWTYQLGRSMINGLRKSSVATLVGGGLDSPLLVNIDKISFWDGPGDKTDFERIQSNKNIPIMDCDVEKVNIFKLKTLVIGYNLPRNFTNKLKLEQVKVFVSGENLLSFHNYSGIDPETVPFGGEVSGYDNGRYYPNPKKITLGLTVKF